MNRLKVLAWTGLIGCTLLVPATSALADRGHVQKQVVYESHGYRQVEVHRIGANGYTVQRNGRSYWIRGHRPVPPRHWERHRHGGHWGRRPWRRAPQTVVIEREVPVESNRSTIQIGPQELSVIIPLPW